MNVLVWNYALFKRKEEIIHSFFYDYLATLSLQIFNKYNNTQQSVIKTA